MDRDLIKHFKWLVAMTYEYAIGFTKEEQAKNEKIMEILKSKKD